jgi:hypothetical protein
VSGKAIALGPQKPEHGIATHPYGSGEHLWSVNADFFGVKSNGYFVDTLRLDHSI